MASPLCGRDQYFDGNIRDCSSCADLCDGRTPNWDEKASFCELKCPRYRKNATSDLSVSFGAYRQDEGSSDSWPTSSIVIVTATLSLLLVIVMISLLANLVRKIIVKRGKSGGIDAEPFIVDGNRNCAVGEGQNDTSMSSSDIVGSQHHHDGSAPNSMSSSPSSPVPTNSELRAHVRAVAAGNNELGVNRESRPRDPAPSAAIINMCQETDVVKCYSGSFRLRDDSSVAMETAAVASAGNESELHSALHLISSEFEARMKMFGWLNSQTWVTEYFEGPDGVEIAVENIDQDQACEQIRRAASEFVSEFDFRIIQPIGGNYIPCPVTSSGDASMPFPATNQYCLCPGVQLYSPRMEPEDDKHQAESGYAMYAGCIRGSWFGKFGITVGHLFDSVGVECQRRAAPCFPFRMTVGKCALKVGYVDVLQSIRRTTADLALIEMTCPAQNLVHVNGRDYRLRLYRGKLDFRRIVSPVAIVTKDGDVRYGRVNNFLFTIDKLGLYNTMSIVDVECQSTRLNNSGDSGALVTSIPGEVDEIFVYGMVIGYYESQDGKSSNTVATRLWDVLECIAERPERSFDIDFADLRIEDLQINCAASSAAVGTLSQPILSSESKETPMDTSESGYQTNMNA